MSSKDIARWPYCLNDQLMRLEKFAGICVSALQSIYYSSMFMLCMLRSSSVSALSRPSSIPPPQYIRGLYISYIPRIIIHSPSV